MKRCVIVGDVRGKIPFAPNILDMKVVQYVMGHSNVGVTMEVYNHITEKARIEKEIAKMNAVKIG